MPIWLNQILNNPMLISSLSAMMLAQFLKVPVDYLITRQWNWELMHDSGGMPSSHSALTSSAALSIGLFEGFDEPAFVIALVLTLIVTYDAAGVRRQAGYHAEKINQMVSELLSGHPLSEENLKEVIGHTPRQVFIGTILGLLVATFWWLILK